MSGNRKVRGVVTEGISYFSASSSVLKQIDRRNNGCVWSELG